MRWIETSHEQVKTVGQDNNWNPDDVAAFSGDNTFNFEIYSDDNIRLGQFGIYSQWPGVGTVWAKLDPGASEHPLQITRGLKEVLITGMEKLKLWRLQSIVNFTDEATKRWHKLVGFEEESVHLYFLPDTSHASMFVLFHNIPVPGGHH